MVVASVSADGQPSARMVLLKGFSADGLGVLHQPRLAQGRPSCSATRAATCSSPGTRSSARCGSTASRPSCRAPRSTPTSPSVRGGSRLGAHASHQSHEVGFPRGAGGGLGGRRRVVPRRGAGARGVGRLPGRPRGRGVLAGPARAAARPAGVPRVPARPPGPPTASPPDPMEPTSPPSARCRATPTTSPPRSVLPRRGWTRCGVGDWAVALRSPSGSLAARISPFDPVAPYTAQLFRRRRRHRAGAGAARATSSSTGGAVCTVMELLQPVDEERATAFFAALERRDAGAWPAGRR